MVQVGPATANETKQPSKGQYSYDSDREPYVLQEIRSAQLHNCNPRSRKSQYPHSPGTRSGRCDQLERYVVYLPAIEFKNILSMHE